MDETSLKLTFKVLNKPKLLNKLTGTTHYSVGKFISELLQPLTLNEYTLHDTFNAANRIKAISLALFTEGYELKGFLQKGRIIYRFFRGFSVGSS